MYMLIFLDFSDKKTEPVDAISTRAIMASNWMSLKKYLVERVKNPLFFLVTYRAPHTAVSGAAFMTPLIGQIKLSWPLIG